MDSKISSLNKCNETVWTGQDILQLTAGKLISGNLKDSRIVSVKIDLASCSPGCLFLISKSELTKDEQHLSQNEFLTEVIEKGPAMIATDILFVDHISSQIPIIRVNNIQGMIDLLATDARKQFKGKIICITENTSKESVCSLLADRRDKLKASYKVVRINNLNELKIQLCYLNNAERHVIFQLNFDLTEDVSQYGALMQPNIIMIAHSLSINTDDFTYIENLCEHQAHLFKYLLHPKIVILSSDVSEFDFLQIKAVEYGAHQLRTYGTQPFADVKFEVCSNINEKRLIIKRDNKVKIYKFIEHDKQSLGIQLASYTLLESLGLSLKLDRVEVHNDTTMKYVGYICDIKEGYDPIKIDGKNQLMRAVSISESLIKFNVQLFIFSRWHVNTETKLVAGYIIHNKQFIPLAREIPKFNVDWQFGGTRRCPNRSGMPFNDFFKWSLKEINVYPSRQFADLASDKYGTFRAIAEIAKELHPYTERYSESFSQLQQFLKLNDTVFFKPRYGNLGNGIIVLIRRNKQITVDYYSSKQKIRKTFSEEYKAFLEIHSLIQDERYVVQKGIQVKKIENKVFDFRAVMINNGKEWTWITQIRLGGDNSDISNLHQGGSLVDSKIFFKRLYDQEIAEKILSNSKEIAINVVTYLNNLFDNSLVEVALDLLIDENDNIYIAEINLKPGLMQPGMNTEVPFIDIFNRTPEEMQIYNTYIKPLGEAVANFLMYKVSNEA